MAKLTVQGVGTFQVPEGKRLVLALEDEARIDQMHACGGNAHCTTCRVKFISGEPEERTMAERTIMAARGLGDSGLRLSCQIVCQGDMHVTAESRVSTTGAKNAGSRPSDAITPPPVWS